MVDVCAGASLTAIHTGRAGGEGARRGEGAWRGENAGRRRAEASVG